MSAVADGKNRTALVGRHRVLPAGARKYTGPNQTEDRGAAAPGTPPGDARPRTGEEEVGPEEVPDEDAEDMDTELEFGSSKCVCTKCGYTAGHADRGIPCNRKSCPKCGSPMKGLPCKGRSR